MLLDCVKDAIASASVEAPTEIDELKIILEEMKKGGPSIHLRPEYYRPLKGYINKKYALSRDLDELEKIPAYTIAISHFKSEYGERVKDYVYFPVIGSLASRLLVIDRKTETVVDYTDINPITNNLG